MKPFVDVSEFEFYFIDSNEIEFAGGFFSILDDHLCFNFITSDGWDWVLQSYDYYNYYGKLTFDSEHFNSLREKYPEACNKIQLFITGKIQK